MKAILVFGVFIELKQETVVKKKIKVQCRKYMSQLKGTWFERHRVPFTVICRFVAYWALLKPPQHETLSCELRLSDHTVVDWSNYLREVCIEVISQQSEKIGGVGKVVEIDEAKIGKR